MSIYLKSLSPYAAAMSLAEVISASTHLALFTANPIEAGDLDDEQPNAAGYARQAITWGSGSQSRSNTNLITFGPTSGAWTGPWYLVVMDSGTHGVGNPIAIVTDANGTPVTTDDLDGVTSVPFFGSLRVPIGELTFSIGAGDPVQDILDLNPAVFFLFDRISYKGTDLLFADEAGTTPITTDGDEVFCAKSLVGNWEATSSHTNGMYYRAGKGLDSAVPTGHRWLLFDLTGAWSTEMAYATIGRIYVRNKYFVGSETVSAFRTGADHTSDNVWSGISANTPGTGDAMHGKKVSVVSQMLPARYCDWGADNYTHVGGTVADTQKGAFARTGYDSNSRQGDTEVTCFVVWDRILKPGELATISNALTQLGNY